MAQPTALNDQVTDAVTQSNASVLGESPAVSMSTLYQSLAHSTAILYESAVGNFQRLGIAGQAVTNLGAIQMYSISSMAGAVATGQIARSRDPESLRAMITAERVGGGAG